jgi:hypothetical protein
MHDPDPPHTRLLRPTVNVWRPGDGFSERALYVLDGDGIIRYAYVSPRPGQIPDSYDLYRASSRISGQHEPVSNVDASLTVGR